MNYFSKPGIECKRFDLNETLMNVCSHFQITQRQIKSKSRLRPISEATGIIAYILVKFRKMTTTQVGALLNKDHSTVSYHCKKVIGLMQVDQKYKELVNSFK